MANTNKAKAKVAEKIGKAKAKIEQKTAKTARKLSACYALAVALLALGGCQNPAQRAQTAEVYIHIYEGANATFGAEFVSLAQSNETGGNDAGLTATQTTETKPEIAVGVGGSSAGVGGTGGASKQGVGAALGAVSGMFGGDSATDEKRANATDAECADGSCSDGACKDCEL